MPPRRLNERHGARFDSLKAVAVIYAKMIKLAKENRIRSISHR
jgi:hypothetical protein